MARATNTDHEHEATERTTLLQRATLNRRPSPTFERRPSSPTFERRPSRRTIDSEARTVRSSALTKEEEALGGSAVGERLPYNDYCTIDWLHDLVKDSYRQRSVRQVKGIRGRLLAAFDSSSGWIIAAVSGTLTACVAYLVDVSVVTVSDWKMGYCKTNPFLGRDSCCGKVDVRECDALFKSWASGYWDKFAIYVAFAILFGLISGTATMLTKSQLPSVQPRPLVEAGQGNPAPPPGPPGKTIYLAAGSGIPEIKTILSGFVIPHYLDLKVLLVKAFGATFAVPTGMALGKEGPFVHIATCMGYFLGSFFPKYRYNDRKMRELLSASCAAGLSVAFGAPIGGVLFSYEEISTYFTRKVLWRAFLCSLFASIVLKELDPTGTGKLVLFETNFGTEYKPVHYLVFVFLGAVGGLYGGLFCQVNFYWSKWFRNFTVIKKYPVLEVFLVTAATALIQFPNPLTREPGDVVIKALLVDCKRPSSLESYVCQSESPDGNRLQYLGWLIYGTIAKLFLLIITFGVKVPSGIIIPSLDAGAYFGRLVGQSVTSLSPGIFAMVSAAAFLAGVSRVTISLVVVMFELTGEVDYIVPLMIAIMVAKWVADSIGREGVYDLVQSVLGHPFLDPDESLRQVQKLPFGQRIEVLLPPKATRDEVTVVVPRSNKVPRRVLEEKLRLLKRRGLMDGGLVLVQQNDDHRTSRLQPMPNSTPTSKSRGVLQGYIAEGELEFGLSTAPHRRMRRFSRDPQGNNLHDPMFHSGLPENYDPGLGSLYPADAEVRLFGDPEEGDFDLSMFVDRSPPVVSEHAPIEYAVEMFGRLGLRYICVLEEGTGGLVGVVIKKRLVAYLENLNGGHG